MDINTIRAWLGHVSLNTTNIYAEVGLEMKAKALATCQIRGICSTKALEGRPFPDAVPASSLTRLCGAAKKAVSYIGRAEQHRHITLNATEELKLDGFRGQGIRDKRGVHLLSRNGKDFSKKFPQER